MYRSKHLQSLLTTKRYVYINIYTYIRYKPKESKEYIQNYLSIYCKCSMEIPMYFVTSTSAIYQLHQVSLISTGSSNWNLREKELCTTGDTRLAGWIHFKTKKHDIDVTLSARPWKRRGFLFVLTYLWCATLYIYMFLCWGYLFTFIFHCYWGTHDDCIVHNNFERPSLL